MDVLKFLKEGNVSANPDYKPKTKKGALEPPYLVDYNPGSTISDRGRSSIAKTAARNMYNLNQYDIDKYADYNVYVNPNQTEEELNQERAKNQSAWEQTGRSIGQMIGNELLIGTALGLSNIVDFAINIGAEKGEDDYTNPVSKWLEDLQNNTRERLEIYREDPNQTWAIGDFGWWADNAVSVASTLSMLIPSTGIVKGLSALGKLSNVSRLTRGLAKAAKGAKLTRNAPKFAKSIELGTEIGGSAILSRTMENYLEARGVYNEVYDSTVGRIKEMTPKEKETLLENNPQFVGKSDEEIASYISSVSADKTFANDYAMLIFDIAQFKAINSLWKGIANKAATANLKNIQSNAIKGLSKETKDAIKKSNWLAKRKEAAQYALSNPLKSIAAVEWSEGIEEGYQGIQTEKGKEVAERILDPSFTPRSLESYLTDGSIWEQAFWGVLGGVGFQAAGTAVGNLATKIKGKINKKTMSEQDYALSQLTEEKIRETEIIGRQGLMQNYVDAMNLINDGKNPYEYQIDPITKQPIIEEGSKVNASITQEEADIFKEKLTNDFITDLTLNAIDVGNYDMLKEFVSDANFNKFFKEAGLQETAGDKNLSQMLITKMEEVNNVYSKALYDILNSIDVTNDGIAKLASRNIARTKLQIDDLNRNISELQGFISNDTDNATITADYIESERIAYAQRVLKELEQTQSNLNKALKDKQISKQAYDQYIKDYDTRRNQLLETISKNTSIVNNENVKTILGESFNKRDVSKFVEEFNKFANDNFGRLFDEKDTNFKATKPKKSLQDLIKKQVNLEDEVSYLQNQLPATQDDYQSLYNELSLNMDKYTIDRYNSAVDRINSYLESYDNLDEAINNIMTGNVSSELKKDLDILKIGHHSTKAFTQQIVSALRQINKDRINQEEKAKEVKIDDTVVSEKAAEEIKAEIDELTPSTGEESQIEHIENPIEFIPIETVDETISNLEKDAERIEEQRARDFILNIDDRASALASSVAFEVFKTSRALFDNLDGKDTNSAEFNNLVNIIAEELLLNGVSRNLTHQAAMDGLKIALTTINRRLKAKGLTKSDNFLKLADEIATKQRVQRNDDGSAAVTTLISDGEFNLVIDDFLKSYIENREIITGKNNKTVINIEDLFQYIINNKDISYEQAKYIFRNIKDFIVSNPSNKYVFSNKRSLNNNLKYPDSFFSELQQSKSTVENIDGYMHITAPTKRSSDYNQLLNRAINGEQVEVSYYKGEQGSSKNSISIKIDGKEIGYIGSVDMNSTGTGFRLRNQNKGFVYDLNKVDGRIESNFDELFIPIINQEEGNASELYDLIDKQNTFETAIENGEIGQDINDKEVEKVLSNELIQKFISDGRIKIPDYKKTNRQKSEYILNQLSNILFYDAKAKTKEEILYSYETWKYNNYINYENTNKIQNALDKDQTIVTRLAGIKQGKVIIDPVNHDISDVGFSYDTNPIMIVDANGNIINENSNVSYRNAASFRPGTMGMLVQDNPNAPVIALFTESNPVSSNSNLANQTYFEVKGLLDKYLDKNISFEELRDSLGELIGGPDFATNNIFEGYNVVKNSENIALNLRGEKGVYNLIIYKHKKGKKEIGTGIVYMPNGDKNKRILITDKNNTKNVAKEIVSNLYFNKTFFAINNKNNANAKVNRYLYKENGQLIVEIGGVKNSYNSFGHFVLANNAFKTNQGQNENGGYFETNDIIKSLYVDIASINSPVEESIAKQDKRSVTDIIRSATENKPIEVSNLLNVAGVSQEQINILTGQNEFELALIPKELYYDKNTTVSNAYYSNGKVYFTKVGSTAVAKSSRNLVRLLLHENLHGKFEELSKTKKDNLVYELFDTYNAFIDAIDNDNSKQADILREWIDKNRFTPSQYFSTLSAAQQKFWATRSQAERDRQFAEEWLVESLSQPAIMNYLNNTQYYEAVDVTGIDNSNKSIFQKIIDILLKLFGKSANNINKNTILARQYMLLSDDGGVQNTIKTGITENTAGETIMDGVVENQEETTSIVTEPSNIIERLQDFSEEFNTDDLVEADDFATTDFAEIVDNKFSPNGETVVSDMDTYINGYPQQDKAKIALMVENGELKFICR